MSKTTKKAAPKQQPALLCVKGFNQDWTCRGFQYEVGKTYEAQTKKFECCAAGGFHSVEMPMDAFSYYGPATSRYADVTASGFIAREASEKHDTKLASARITIDAELRFPDLIARAVRWVLERAQGNTATGDSGHAAATGNYGHAAATGDSGHAAATGNYGHAAATGDSGCAFAGFGGKAKCGEKGSFAIAWFHDTERRAYLAVGTPGVGGIKADTWYRVQNGKLVEVAP